VPDWYQPYCLYASHCSVARFGRLDSSSSGIHSFACSLVHSELSWWGVKSSLHLHVAHMHYCSHYSVRSPTARQLVTSERGVCGGPWLSITLTLCYILLPSHVSHWPVSEFFFITLSVLQSLQCSVRYKKINHTAANVLPIYQKQFRLVSYVRYYMVHKKILGPAD
jgi:hypothetical protein